MLPVRPYTLLTAPDVEHRRRRNRRRQELATTIPPCDHPTPQGLPRGGQVFLNRARSGYAYTDDVVSRWRKYAPQPTSHDGNLYNSGSTAAFPRPVLCFACNTKVTSTIRHLGWDCGAFDRLRAKYRPAWVLFYEDCIMPRDRYQATLAALWHFVCEAAMAAHY